MNTATQTQQKPWYKQFWPWFLIALPTAAVIASLSTVIFAFKHADVVVQDNYYKEGLAINTQVNDLNMAKSLGLTASLLLDEGTLNFTLAHQADTFTAPETITISFTHPLDDKQDTQVVAQSAGNQTYRASMPKLQKSVWHIDIEGSNGQATWRLKYRGNYPEQSISINSTD